MNCSNCPIKKECEEYKHKWVEAIDCLTASDYIYKQLENYCPLIELIYNAIDQKVMTLLSSLFLSTSEEER